jgi:hypothetical protein
MLWVYFLESKLRGEFTREWPLPGTLRAARIVRFADATRSLVGEVVNDSFPPTNGHALRRGEIPKSYGGSWRNQTPILVEENGRLWVNCCRAIDWLVLDRVVRIGSARRSGTVCVVADERFRGR